MKPRLSFGKTGADRFVVNYDTCFASLHALSAACRECTLPTPQVETHFFESVRTRKPSGEDVVFGNHTAIACHRANYSLENRAMAVWDAASKTIKS